MMKRYLSKKIKLSSVLFLLLLGSSFSFGQDIEITPYYGYMFAGKLALYQGDFNIKNDANYGITIDLELDRKSGVSLELLYDRIDTRAVLKKYPTNITEDLFDMSVEYYQIGGLYNKPMNKKFSTFGVFTFGAARMAPVSTKFGDDWRFAVTAGGGIKYFFSKSIGIRLTGRLKMPFYFSGGSVWIGPGGITYGLGAGTALLQGDLTAGLIIRLGK
ncbi:MAG: hypothetical protein GXO85_16015 [Chlorobi bacterium]|nr:hypothetical protein [Chlorobiota bacterium]